MPLFLRPRTAKQLIKLARQIQLQPRVSPGFGGRTWKVFKSQEIYICMTLKMVGYLREVGEHS